MIDAYAAVDYDDVYEGWYKGDFDGYEEGEDDLAFYIATGGIDPKGNYFAVLDDEWEAYEYEQTIAPEMDCG